MFFVFRILTLCTLGLVLGACHSRPTRIDCEAHLQPINAPAPMADKSEKRP
jgi:hypothetical protein